MGFTAFYGGKSYDRHAGRENALKVLDRAVELSAGGKVHLDTAWIYQSFGADGNPNTTNEELVGEAIQKHGRDKFIVATKFGIVPTAEGMGFSGTEETIRSQLSDSLARLKIDYIDLYYQHRMDPSTPIEETIRVLKSLIDEGKIKYIGLSECTPSELRRAHAVHPVTAVQLELSLQTRDALEELVPVCKELGVGVVCYSPLGRGFLSKTFQKREELPEGDWRLSQPRFSEENFEHNAAGASKFFEIADSLGVKPGPLALAWVLAQGDNVVVIPGSKQMDHLEQNFSANDIHLTPEQVKMISDSVPEVKGLRYEGNWGTWNSRMGL